MLNLQKLLNVKMIRIQTVLTAAVIFSFLITDTIGIRFVIDREECLSHNVDYEGDTVHVSFVVIKAESPWHFSEDGVDFLVLSSIPSLPMLTSFF